MTPIEFISSSDFAIGVDIGGTKINAGIIDRNGQILLQHHLPTLAQQGEVLNQVKTLISKLLNEYHYSFDGTSLKGIGIGSAGQIDWNKGSIRYANSLIPGYTGTKLKDELEHEFAASVIVDNDVNCLALTEKYLGAAQNKRNVICLTLGTGVGGAILIDGKIIHGAWGGAAEIGHMTVDFNGVPCHCGSIGCLEQYASGTGIAWRMQELLMKQGIGTTQIEAKKIIADWIKGDPTAALVMNQAIAALGSAIASLVHIFNPEAIIIGGGVAEAGAPLIDGIKAEMKKRAMSSLVEGVDIFAAYKGNLGGMIGAALQLWEYDEIGTRVNLHSVDKI